MFRTWKIAKVDFNSFVSFVIAVEIHIEYCLFYEEIHPCTGIKVEKCALSLSLSLQVVLEGERAVEGDLLKCRTELTMNVAVRRLVRPSVRPSLRSPIGFVTVYKC